MADNLLAGERGGMNGPFNVTLRSPEVGDQAQKLGALVRFHSTLPNRLNEMAILMTAVSGTLNTNGRPTRSSPSKQA